MTLQRTSCFLVIGILSLAADSVRAVDLTWDATSGFLFFDSAANWDPQQSPTGADDLLFDIDTVGNPIIVGATSLFSDMRFSDFDWTLTGGAGGTLTSTTGSVRIDDPTSTDLAGGVNVALTDGLVLDATEDFYVGQQGFGGLSVETGADAQVRSVFIGEDAGSTGQVTVTGVGSTLIADGLSGGDGYYIGSAGTGTLSVTAGGLARIGNDTSGAIADVRVGHLAGGVGALTIDGAGSQFIAEDSFFGNAGSATVSVTGGGRLLQTIGSSPDAIVGGQASGNGDVVVNGAGSEWQARRIEIGNLGDATLSVEAGGLVRSNAGEDMVLGDANGSTGRVAVFGSESGTASTLDVAQSLFVGNNGRGELFVGRSLGSFVDDAGELTVGSDLIIGRGGANTLDNRMVIDGAEAAATVVGDAIVGGAGRGTLNLVGGGSLNAANLLIGQADGNTNDNVVTASGAGSVIDVTNNVEVGVSGRGNLAIAGATLNVGGAIDIGAATNGEGIFSASGATITAAGGFQAGTGVDSSGVAVLDNGTTLTALELFLGNSGATDTSPAIGAMTVRGGSTVTLTRTDPVAVTLGDDPGTMGTLTVTGTGSSVVSGGTAEWWVGGSVNDDGGTGTLNVFEGATATSGGRVVVGYDTTGANIARGFINVDGAGSTLNAGADLMIVGFQGSGEVDVTGGGTLNANAVFIADESGSAGSDLTVDGAGSTLNLQERLFVGRDVRGTMTVSGGATVNVALDPNASNVNQRLIVGDGAGSDGSRLTLTGAGTRLEYFGDDDGIRVGLLGGSTSNRALLEVLDGAVLNAVQRNPDQTIASQGFLIVGDESDGNGEVVVSGAGSRINAQDLRLGNVLGNNFSRGTVTVNNGGVINVTGLAEIADNGRGTSTMSVTGAGSRFEVGSTLAVGSGQSGTATVGSLTIADGAVVTNGGTAYVGRFSASTGTATVGGTGEGASWNVGADLILAGDRTDLVDAGSQTSGSGTLNVQAGGTVTVADRLFVKDRGVINLDGGELIADDIVFQDLASRSLSPDFNFNSGTLRYTADKNFSAGNVATVFSGEPAVLDAGKHLAFDGVGVLGGPIQIDGGTLSVGSITAINFQTRVDFDAGTFNLTDAGLLVTAAGLLGPVAVIDEDETINVTNSVFVEGDGLLNVAGGTLTMGGGSVSAGGALVVAGGEADFGGGLTNNGDVVLVDAVTAGTLINNADLTLVNTVLGGGLTANATGTISLGIGATGNADVLALSGSAALAGTLEVSLDATAGLAVGDEIDLLIANAGVTGTFDTEVLPSPSGGLAFDLLYDANRVAIIVTLAGDYNGDGTVNAADYTVWRDGDSPDSSLAGYDVWAGNYGATAATAASNAVPEPSSALAMATAIVVGAVRRRR